MEDIFEFYQDFMEDKSKFNDFFFLLCCKNGNLELLKWILHYDYKLDISNNDDLGFCVACESNNIEVAKWLYEKSPNNNINNTEYILEICCENGFDELLNWILSNNVNNLSNFNFCSLFTLCIFNENYDSAKVIFRYSKNILINNDNDFLFREACNNNNIELVKLLLHIRPNAYFVNIIDDKIVHYEIINSLIIENDIFEKELHNIEECYICYSKSNVYTSCKHFYCFDCLEKYFSYNNNNCPYCRNQINEWNLFNIK